MPIKRTTFSLCQVVFRSHSVLFLHKKNLMFLQPKRKSAAVHSDKNKTFSSYEKKSQFYHGYLQSKPLVITPGNGSVIISSVVNTFKSIL